MCFSNTLSSTYEGKCKHLCSPWDCKLSLRQQNLTYSVQHSSKESIWWNRMWVWHCQGWKHPRSRRWGLTFNIGFLEGIWIFCSCDEKSSVFYSWFMKIKMEWMDWLGTRLNILMINLFWYQHSRYYFEPLSMLSIYSLIIIHIVYW